MKKIFPVLSFMTVLLLTIVNSTTALADHTTVTTLPLSASYKQVHSCSQASSGFAQCLAIVLKPTGLQAHVRRLTPDGLTPVDLHNAYQLPASGAGSGKTIAIIDAYNNPSAEADLAVYRATFGLPECTSANGCFQKIDQRGGQNYPAADAGWAGEIALDLDMVSAISPKSHILLVEADSNSFDDLGHAVDTAVRLGATSVSNSYGGEENRADALANAHYYNHSGVAITASAGDSGYGVMLPAAFKTVIAVGGTSLSHANNARGWSEVVWSDGAGVGTGSGCSLYIRKPAWQKDKGCRGRSVADVSAIADPQTGVAVYNTYQSLGDWFVYGGTSASAPIIAAVYALSGHPTHTSAAYLYKHAGNLNDIIKGSNGTCHISYLCNAGRGYDGPTGLGTPKGIGAF